LAAARPNSIRGALAALLAGIRPRQWVKNAVLVAGILFTLDQGHPAEHWLRVAGAIAAFCALSGGIYLVNDLCDLEQDRLHPRKRHRPLASGALPVGLARGAAVVLIAASLLGAAGLGAQFLGWTLAYVGLTFSYSFFLKHVVLLDVLALAGFYVIRAAAGAVVVDVQIGPWLLVCTTFGALLVGLAKRRNELLTLDDAPGHRRSLDEYSVQMLDQMIVVLTGCTLSAYLIYTVNSETAARHPQLIWTIPFAVYGVLRFFYLVHRHGKGGDPSVELLEDRGVLLCGLGWILACVYAMAWGG
jgi:4-hydroxybenzoate polyprenyltransferase